MANAVVDGVLFDVDDTLIDTRSAFARAIGAVRQAFLAHQMPDREVEMLAMWRADAGGHYRAYTRGQLSEQEQRRRRADELHAAFGGRRVDEAFYPEWNQVFSAGFTRSFTAHDDVLPILDLLMAAGVRVGSVTNAPHAVQASKLNAARILGVPVLVGVDTLGFGKPDPRVFLEGCRRLGTDPARTAYIGDEWDVDASAAAAAGLIGVWLDRPDLPPRSARPGPGLSGFHRITDLAALPALLGLPAASSGVTAAACGA